MVLVSFAVHAMLRHLFSFFQIRQGGFLPKWMDVTEATQMKLGIGQY
jgi:hypothetical protein